MGGEPRRWEGSQGDGRGAKEMGGEPRRWEGSQGDGRGAKEMEGCNRSYLIAVELAANFGRHYVQYKQSSIEKVDCNTRI